MLKAVYQGLEVWAVLRFESEEDRDGAPASLNALSVPVDGIEALVLGPYPPTVVPQNRWADAVALAFGREVSLGKVKERGERDSLMVEAQRRSALMATVSRRSSADEAKAYGLEIPSRFVVAETDDGHIVGTVRGSAGAVVEIDAPPSDLFLGAYFYFRFAQAADLTRDETLGSLTWRNGRSFDGVADFGKRLGWSGSVVQRPR